MRRAYVGKINSLVGFDVDPAAVRKTTRKNDNVRPCGIDHREFQIAVERCGIYQLPFHDA
jgi:hypothetical protein